MPSKYNLEKLSVVFLTKYGRNGASSRYRYLQYLPKLETAGINCAVCSLLEDSYLQKRYERGYGSMRDFVGAFCRRLGTLLQAHRYHLLWIEYELFPYCPAIFETILARFGISYVVDYDDAIFHQYDRHKNWFVRRMLGEKISRVMRNATLVIAGNEYLADYARKAGSKQVEIIPTVVDITRYPLKTTVESSMFTIGWIGSPSTSKYLKEIAPALAEICRNGQAQVTLIGSGQIDLPGVPVTILPWSETTEVENLQRFDVGIMPLSDSPWERGKCGFKLIQYMACGLPVIASPVGVNSQIVEEGVNGFLATTTQEWVRAFNMLRDSYHLRKQMGQEGRKKVESQYCLEVTAPKLVSLLYQLCQDKNEP